MPRINRYSSDDTEEYRNGYPVSSHQLLCSEAFFIIQFTIVLIAYRESGIIQILMIITSFIQIKYLHILVVCVPLISQPLLLVIGDFIDNIHQNWWGNYRLLEFHHSYIQW